MSSEKSPVPENASERIHLPSLIGLKTFPDDSLPLYTDSGVRARVSSSWKRGFLVVSSLCLLLVFVRGISISRFLSTPSLPSTVFLPATSPLLSTPSLLATSSLPSTASIPLPSPTLARNPAYLITADRGAVATENKRCSDIGVKTLQDGGNAVDAVISASLCLGVVNMFSSGISGGGFMVIRVPPTAENGSSEVFTVDFRETAPARASKAMFVDNPLAAQIGGLSVAVPGELRGLEAARHLWGNSSLPWHKLVEPSVELAAGWTVDVELAKRLQNPNYSQFILASKDWSDIFAPRGRLLREGEIIRRTNYSRTLDTIANQGPGALYQGPIADSIIRKVTETGGILTHADLGNYTVKVERALEGTYHDKKVYTSPAPTSGPVLLHMLNLLERFDLIREGRTPLNVHRIVEAMKFGFAARTRIGDLSYYRGNKTRVAEIPTKEFANKIAVNLTDDRTHQPEYYNPEFDIQTDHGTSHISVVDKNGMAVSLTTTVNLVFGARVLDQETGIILNDEMDDFSIPGKPNAFGLWPSPYNFPEPGKRPLSSIAPAIFEYSNGSLYLAAGGAGGSQILTAVFQTLLNVEWGMDASEAVEYGRVHDQLYPKQVNADNILPKPILDGLRERGHNVKELDINRMAAVVQTVVRKHGKLYAASDSRKNGIAAGY